MSVELTAKTAWELIGRIVPNLKIRKVTTSPEKAIFLAYTGPDGLDIICENDWYDRDGLIRLTISDGCERITQHYDPRTLERVYIV